MDKKSEQRKDHKECGDVDIGVYDYGSGGKCGKLNGLWSIAPEEVVGLPPSRLMTNCYGKEVPGEKHEKPSLLDEVIEHGPPLINTSRPKRVF